VNPDLYDAHDLPEPTDSKETSQMTHHTSDSHADLTILTIETPTLGDRGYLVHDGEVAFVVDPQRDIDRVLDLLDEHQVRLTHVAETHLHNDFVTGGYALAEHTGATYLVNGEDDVSFSRTPVADGDVIEVGERMRLTALATPGHTFTHLSYALTDAATGKQVAVFTGGSLLFGATGRPDLLGAEHTHDLVHHQHASAHKLAELLPDDAEVLPTHGFGSFCSASQSDATSSTIGQEKESNPVLTQDEQTYVDELLAGLGPYPAYYAHMGPANAAGPSAPDLSPPAKADAVELRRRIEAGEWVVDLRTRTAFAAGHAPGTLNFGLDGAFVTYLGWLIPWGTPVTLLGESADDVAEAQRELVRIGIERPAAHATGGPEQWSEGELSSFPTATFADLAQVRHHRDVVVLDVRRADEHDKARIDGAVNVPIHELPQRLDDVPAGEVWVHCAGGYRASVAASFLSAAGRNLVAVDDSFDNAEKVGLHLVGPEA
jgi:hydroxyacylglutathione hydrolase